MKYENRTSDMISKTLRKGFAALLLLAAAACTEEIPDTGTTGTGGRQATVSLSVSTTPIGAGMPGTRAIPDDIDEGTEDGYKVEDFWLMEYDDKGNLIGTPQYFESGDLTDGETAIPIILPTDDGTKYQCVVVANTHNKVFEAAIGDASTIDKLKRLGRKIEGPDDLYDKGGKDLLMNCVMPVTSATDRLDCKLYRNIAKLTLTLKNNAGSGVRLNTVQLCNVADRLCYANRLYEGASAPSPTTSEAGFISWKAETVGIDEGGEQELTYYLPRNCRGTTDNELTSQKNKKAPEYATYIEIMAEDKKNGTPVRYRFYPGKNMTNDFNIVPNLHYILPITIAGKGDTGSDSRVEDLGNLELKESNCYIVNPLNGSAQQLYSVPISRINRFWGSSDGKLAVNDDGEQMDNTISTNTVWVAEVIWQDAPTRLIDFCDEKGNRLEDKDTYESTGLGYFHFKPREGARGNVLVGVRKESAGKRYYLWSWHLWITDYNPDGYGGSWREGVYSYPVAGGAVHRYAGSGNNNVWDVKYKDKFIMDRNLGAMGASADAPEASRGFYYQYGRKDPFPYPKTALYDINGEPQSTFTASSGDCVSIVIGKAHLYASVFRPYTFYAGGNIEWVQDNPYTSSAWNNPAWYTDGNGKSIFDPSPQGWRLPENNNIWNIFSNKGRPNAKGYPEIGELAFRNGWNFYMGGLSVGETAWYPAASIRNGNNGTVGGMTTGNYWTSLSALYYNKDGVSLMSGTHSSGYSVRCVKE